MGKKRLELLGKKINKLTVIEDVGSFNNRSIWKVRCECGNEKIVKGVDLTKSKPLVSCGCYAVELLRKRVTGKNNHGWKGGVSCLDGGGYLTYRHGKLRGVKVHRHVYEQHYGIKLLPHQNVHHINGDRTDNRIENLELWDTSQPSGQRVKDKIEFYFKLVDEYRNHPEYKELISKHDRIQ